MLNTDTLFKKVIDLTNRGSWEKLLNNSLTIPDLKKENITENEFV
jgi:hypothetical protein